MTINQIRPFRNNSNECHILEVELEITELCLKSFRLLARNSCPGILVADVFFRYRKTTIGSVVISDRAFTPFCEKWDYFQHSRGNKTRCLNSNGIITQLNKSNVVYTIQDAPNAA